MGYRAIMWAFEQEAGTATNKAVLLAAAKFANNEGTCFPSCDTLAKLTNCNERTVRRALRALEKRSLILRKQRRRKDGQRTSDLIVLLAGDKLVSNGHPRPGPTDNRDHCPGQDVRAESCHENIELPKDKRGRLRSNVVDFPMTIKSRTASTSLSDAIARRLSQESPNGEA